MGERNIKSILNLQDHYKKMNLINPYILGGSNLPLTIPNLWFWLSTSNVIKTNSGGVDYITGFNDLSPNGMNFTSLNSTLTKNAKLISRNGILMADNNNKQGGYVSSVFSKTINEFTIFCDYEFISKLGILFFGNSGTIGIGDYVNTFLGSYVGGISTYFSSGYNIGEHKLLTCRSKNGTNNAQIWQNSTLKGTFTIASLPKTIIYMYFLCQSQSAGPLVSMDGYMSNFLFFDRYLSDSEISSMQSFLITQCNII